MSHSSPDCHRALLACSLFVLLGAAACDGPEEPDPPADGGPPPTCEEAIPPFETGDADGHADSLNAASGEARAGRLDEADLPEDRTGLSTVEPGDFVIANARYALIIEDAGESDGYDPFGGRPVGVAAVEAGALVGAGDFNEILMGFGGFLVATEAVTVLNDGADGAAAIVRATGPLGRLEFAGDLLADTIGREDFTGLPAAMDYVMEPGADAVEIYMEVAQPDPRSARVPMLPIAFFQHYRMPIWTEDGGFVKPSGAIASASFVDDAGTSYAWLAPPDAELAPLLDQSGVLVFQIGRGFVPGCETERFHLGTMVLGGPGLGGLQASLARHRGETLRTITGTVTEADGSPAADDVRLHVRREDGRHYARLSAAADGTFAIDVPEEAVTLETYRPGLPATAPLTVGASEATADVALPAFGTIDVTVTDTADPAGPLPARVQVITAAGAADVAADMGERRPRHGRTHVAFTPDGTATLRVPAGQHEVVISRGFEYELATETVSVAAGESVAVTAALERVVDTTGVMCADYHIHTHRSPDSPDSSRLKLLGLIADGLEIPIRSDHEWINDFQPEIEAMGLDGWAFGIGGEELTTFAWGHFGVFPLVADTSRRSGGAIDWVGRLPPAVFGDVRARPEAPVLIINHPRSGGSFGGYFSAAGFEPVSGAIAKPDHWDDDFTLVEVFNDDSFDEVRDSVVADWFSLLRSGRRVYAVGSSDSHDIFGSPVGYPRTCLELGVDDPRMLDANTVRDATSAGHSTISGGIYLAVAGPDGSGPGDDVSSAGSTATFAIDVQAASWIRGDLALEVIVDGETTETIPIREADRDPTNPVRRLSVTDLEVPVAAEGSWVVFHVSSDADLAPVHPGRAAFAVSNPVFLSP